MRIPTRLTWRTPPSATGSERTSAHTTPYCSPGGASSGTLIVTVDVTRPPAGMSDAAGSTDVQSETSFGVCPAAPRKEPSSIVAAEEYRTTCIVESVVFETSTLRWMTVPGAR